MNNVVSHLSTILKDIWYIIPLRIKANRSIFAKKNFIDVTGGVY